MSKKASQPVPSDPLKMLVYGPPGQGKTHLMGTAAGDDRLMPMILADFEAGTRSIRSKIDFVPLEDLASYIPSIDKIVVVKIRRWRDFDDLYEFLSGEHPYKTIALDSLSEMNYLNLNENVEDAIRGNSHHDPEIPERGDYLRSSTQMRKLIRFFRDLDMNVIFSAGAMEVEDARTKRPQARPSLTGKLSGEIPGLVDILGYMAIIEDDDETYRSLLVQPTERYMAKARDESGTLGERIDRPTLPEILDLYNATQA